LRFPGVLLGPGDDCALVDPRGPVLLTVDHVVAGRHVPEWSAGGVSDALIDLTARKAMARSISDIAAMAGTPIASLATACLPAWLSQSSANALFDRMKFWAERWHAPLVGGDIASLAANQPGPLVLTSTVLGRPHATRGPVLRSGARIGDGVYVTGALGGSLASGRHATFEPRVTEARALADTLGPDLTAMMDLSDGLGLDGARLARASGVRLELDARALPLHADVVETMAAIADGEDYELLFTARSMPPASLSAGGPVPVTRIGTVVAGEPGCWLRTESGLIDASRLGWDHEGQVHGKDSPRA
jgi:thiamine-monophosphate kinase